MDETIFSGQTKTLNYLFDDCRRYMKTGAKKDEFEKLVNYGVDRLLLTPPPKEIDTHMKIAEKFLYKQQADEYLKSVRRAHGSSFPIKNFLTKALSPRTKAENDFGIRTFEEIEKIEECINKAIDEKVSMIKGNLLDEVDIQKISQECGEKSKSFEQLQKLYFKLNEFFLHKQQKYLTWELFKSIYENPSITPSDLYSSELIQKPASKGVIFPHELLSVNEVTIENITPEDKSFIINRWEGFEDRNLLTAGFGIKARSIFEKIQKQFERQGKKITWEVINHVLLEANKIHTDVISEFLEKDIRKRQSLSLRPRADDIDYFFNDREYVNELFKGDLMSLVHMYRDEKLFGEKNSSRHIGLIKQFVSKTHRNKMKFLGRVGRVLKISDNLAQVIRNDCIILDNLEYSLSQIPVETITEICNSPMKLIDHLNRDLLQQLALIINHTTIVDEQTSANHSKHLQDYLDYIFIPFLSRCPHFDFTDREKLSKSIIRLLKPMKPLTAPLEPEDPYTDEQNNYLKAISLRDQVGSTAKEAGPEQLGGRRRRRHHTIRRKRKSQTKRYKRH